MSAGDSAFEVADAMGHLDPRLVSVVYARFQQPDGQVSGERLAKVYAPEWKAVAGLLADNVDRVTAEDVVDAHQQEADADEVDPVDALSGALLVGATKMRHLARTNSTSQ